MGSTASTNPCPLLKEPWMQINWGGDRENDLQFVMSNKSRADTQKLRILLHGPVGGGKSSFINSVYSIFQGRVSTIAVVDNGGGNGCTKKFSTYTFQKDDGQKCNTFEMSDMSGLDNYSRRNRIVHVKDIKEAMKGHIKDGYMFNPECKISKEDRYFNESLADEDRVHVLVCVIDATTATQLKPEVVETIQNIRDEAANLGIPQVAILTKIDEVCPKIKRDVKDVYRSKVLRSKINRFSKKVGIPVNCIFPVKNYREEIKLNNDTDVLILNTMRRIIEIGDDFLKKKKKD